MAKKLLVALFLFLSAGIVWGQCYDYNRKKGIELYNLNKKDRAVDFFQQAKKCPDAPANSDVDKWIAKCRKNEVRDSTVSIGLNRVVRESLISSIPNKKNNVFLPDTIIRMRDDDSVVFHSEYMERDLYENQETVLANQYFQRIMHEPLLKSVKISDYENDIKYLVGANMTEHYNNDIFTYPCCDFKDMLHKIIRNKTVRAVGVGILSDIFVDLCKLYPKDYQRDLLQRLQSMLDFLNQIPYHEYGLRYTDDEGLVYFIVDGDWDYDLPLSWNGFLLRRILIDDIPVDELREYINRLMDRIENLDISDNDEVIRTVSINDDMYYCESATGNYYYFPSSSKVIYMYSDYYNRRYAPTRVVYNTNGYSGYYRISTGYESSKRWLTRSSSDRNSIIVDRNGNIILEE